jgi:hypothetical protein
VRTPEITGLGGSAPLIGRERELGELRSGLAAAREGRGRVFLVAGDPGIGKTRLAEAVADEATAEGLLPLWAGRGRARGRRRTGRGPRSCGG